jgi:large subunit ribosomal protein L10
MARRLKELITKDLDQRLGDVSNALMCDISRLSAEENRAYRVELRKVGITVNVVKNSLARRVFAGQGLEFPRESFAGPTAILISQDDVIGTSKVVHDWRKKNKKEIPLKGGLLEGEVLGPSEAEQLVNMPSVLDTRQMLVSVIAAPLSQMVGITNNILVGVPAVLNAIVDKKKEEGE